jgi:hypothetical protein
MAISNININSLVGSTGNSTIGTVAARVAEGGQTGVNQQPSATVTLSSQGQKLSQSQTNSIQSSQSQFIQTQTTPVQTASTVDTTVTPNAVPQSLQTTAAPGIQFMAGERKSGHVNTFA